MQQRAWMMGAVMCTMATAIAGMTACGGNKDAAADAAQQPPVAGKLSATPAADSDVAVQGNGLPTGYTAQFDSPSASATDASYREDGNGRWEVQTGPAHIAYSAADTGRKGYSVTATFEQLSVPEHPEAFGVFFGGTSLNDPAARRYTYVVLRGDGKYAIKARKGASVRTIADWTAHPAIPAQDASGKGVYGIKVDVDGKTARLSVNGKPVTSFPIKDLPVDGLAGVRINHNLHLMVTPVAVVGGK